MLKSNLCIESCPAGTVHAIKDILFKNTTVSNVSVCIDCAVFWNDSSCVYCNCNSRCDALCSDIVITAVVLCCAIRPIRSGN